MGPDPLKIHTILMINILNFKSAIPLISMKLKDCWCANLLPTLQEHSLTTNEGPCSTGSKILANVWRGAWSKVRPSKFKMWTDLIEKWPEQNFKDIGDDLDELHYLMTMLN